MNNVFAIIVIWLGVLSCSHAEVLATVVDVDEYNAGQSITALSNIYLADTTTDNIEDVIRIWQDGHFSKTTRNTISTGMSQQPVWVRLALVNKNSEIQYRQLLLGASWVDYIDVYFVSPDADVLHWQAGDEVAGAPYFEPALGYVTALPIPPGESAVYIRAQSVDPLVLSLSMTSPENLPALVSSTGHAYGLLYGFLFAFIIYNLILFSALKQRRLLFYSLYLLTFLVMNLSYTGRMLGWVWSELPFVNRYAMPLVMVLLPLSGLRFARSALEMKTFAPKLATWITRLQWSGLLLLLPCMVFDLHELAAWVGFTALTVFIPVMVILGVVMLKHGQIFSRYFLAAAIAAMAGSAITEFAIWGFIPFTAITFHAMEFGMMLDATILAVGLSQHVRQQRKQRKQAEILARVDALTQLFNRRGFYEFADPQCVLAVRHCRPLSLIMIDLDHFKPLNDNYGHSVGDKVLVEFGKLISQNLRTNDIAARWGGEEFVVLLPETSVLEANTLAERLREMTLKIQLEGSFPAGTQSASFGIATLTQEQTLEAMMAAADSALYKAKSLGRNRVEIHSN
jgi:diguanylate cyclase (GGDEF)-like protein